MIKKIIKMAEHTEFYTKEKCFISEIFNFEDFSNFSVAQTRVEPGITTEVHRLIDTDEVYYILSGKGAMEIDGEILGAVSERDIIFIPKNSTQRITNSTDKDLLFLCICSPRFEDGNYR